MKRIPVWIRLALVASLAFTPAALTAQQENAPEIPNLAGKILTVKGPIDPSEAGPTLMHEHIFIKFKTPTTAAGEWNEQTEDQTKKSKLAMEKAPTDWVDKGVDPPWAKGFPKGWNTLDDFDTQLSEVMEFKKAGGGTIVDVSNFGLTRNPAFLLKISESSGLHIVMGGSWYEKNFFPRDMSVRTVEELTEIIVHDVTVGALLTKIRAGIIGEIGATSVTKDELKITRASARAARITGAPMTFHTGGSTAEEKQKILDIVAEEGADLNHVVMGHNGTGNVAAMKKIADRGAYIEFDGIGWGEDGTKAKAIDGLVQNIVKLINGGLTDRILLSHDVCTNYQLKKNKGGGYGLVSNVVIPALKAKGVSDETLKKILVENPRRALTFVAPKPLVY